MQQTSIVVANLQTLERYAQGFEVECWTHPTTGTRQAGYIVPAYPSSSTLSGSLSGFVQGDPMMFTGLSLGQTFYFRDRVHVIAGGPPSPWSAPTGTTAGWVTEVAGDLVAPNPSYSASATVTAAGVVISANPAGNSSDFDHFEIYYALNNSSTPAVTQGPTITRSPNGQFSVVVGDSDVLYAWIRAVDTSGNDQAWNSLGSFTSNGAAVSAGSLGISSDNLVKNGDLTLGNSNWVDFTGATVPSSSFFTGVTGLPRGSSELKSSAAGAAGEIFSKELVPIDINKVYFIECWFKIGSPGTGTFYGGFAEYDSTGAKLSTGHIPTGSTFAYCLFSGMTTTTANGWQYFTAEVSGSSANPTATQFNSSAKYITAMFLFNNAGTPVQGEMLGFRFSEVAAGHSRALTAIDGSYIIRVGSFDFARGYTNKHLDNIPDGSTYARPLSSRISAGKPLIDFSEGIHSNKHLDNISDGSTYARPLSSRVSSGKPLIDFSEAIHLNKSLDNVPDGTRAAWDSTTQKSAAVDSSGNLLLKNIAQTTATTANPTTTSTSFAIVPEMTLTITTTGANKVLLLFTCVIGVPAGTTTFEVSFGFFKDGTQIGATYTMASIENNTSSSLYTISMQLMDSPSNASHTYTVQWKNVFGAPSIEALQTYRSLQLTELG